LPDSFSPTEPAGDQQVTGPDPDQAWKVLQLVNDWVRHAETKLAATLGAAGISGGLLYSLAANRNDASVPFNIAAAICCTAVIVAGIAAMIGLLPTLRHRTSTSSNPLYFDDIQRAYRGDTSRYRDALHAITTDRGELLGLLGQQIQAVSGVASRKFRWANLSIRALFVDLVALGALTLLIAFDR
jgi:hypothetical protein